MSSSSFGEECVTPCAIAKERDGKKNEDDDIDIDIEGDFEEQIESNPSMVSMQFSEKTTFSDDLVGEQQSNWPMTNDQWNFDEMDEESRATIKQMLKEEDFYFRTPSSVDPSKVSEKEDKGKANKSKPVSQKSSRKRQSSDCEAQSEKKKLRIPWTPEEETLLKEGLNKFGKDYKKLESHISGRSVAQIKYYVKKLSKGKSDTEREYLNQAHTPSLSPPAPPSSSGSPTIASISTSTNQLSSVNLPSHKTLWSDDEHEVFLTALEKFGVGNWKMIAVYIKTRNALQVKNHARQHFKKLGIDYTTLKHKKKNKTPKTATKLKSESEHSTTESHFGFYHDEKVNIATSEVESDDAEDLDIGDVDIPPELIPKNTVQTNTVVEQTSSTLPLAQARVEVESNDTNNFDGSDNTNGQNDNLSNTTNGNSDGENSAKITIPSEQNSSNQNSNSSTDEENEEKLQNDTSKTLPEPEAENVLDANEISDREMANMPEFFCGNAVKTPSRYLKIRNYIIDMWQKVKPKYLAKIAVRPGLKDCGDVNAIGRIHEYLERAGYINFGIIKPIKKKQHNRSKTLPKAPSTHSPLPLAPSKVASPVTGSRKRKVRSTKGTWVYEEDLEKEENKTTDHQTPVEETEKNLKYFAEDYSRSSRGRPARDKKQTHYIEHALSSDFLGRKRFAYDPFRLIGCRRFGTDPPPFRLFVCSNAMLVMDLHAHISRTEIIGLLGGRYDERNAELQVLIAIPCNSTSTDVQCEMDPISEMAARDVLSSMEMEVVGWYHSHPTFAPNPSLRDIENQAAYQKLCAKGNGEEPFIGVIVSPYDTRSASDKSQWNFVTVSQHWAPNKEFRIPYQLDKQIICSSSLSSNLLSQLLELLRKYSTYQHRVNMADKYRRGEPQTHLEKLLHSLSANIFVSEQEGSAFLQALREVLVRDYSTITTIGTNSHSQFAHHHHDHHSTPRKCNKENETIVKREAQEQGEEPEGEEQEVTTIEEDNQKKQTEEMVSEEREEARDTEVNETTMDESVGKSEGKVQEIGMM